MKLHFQYEEHVDTIFLIHILTIYCEFFFFLFFSRVMRTHIAIRTGVQNRRISHRKHRSTVCQLFDLYADYLPQMISFPVLYWWHTYALYHPNRGSKNTHYSHQNGYILLKTLILKSNFQDDGQLYANCLFYVPLFCLNCLFFRFFNRGICMHIAVLTGVQKGHNIG